MNSITNKELKEESPKEIWLQFEESPLEETATWCGDKINDSDIKYIRADLVAQALSTVGKEGYEAGCQDTGEDDKQVVEVKVKQARKEEREEIRKKIENLDCQWILEDEGYEADEAYTSEALLEAVEVFRDRMVKELLK